MTITDWSKWPQGTQPHNVHWEKIPPTCPICWEPLRLVDDEHGMIDPYTEYHSLTYICIRCKSRYHHIIDHATECAVVSPDPDTEAIAHLEARIAQLEAIVKSLQSTRITTHNSSNGVDDKYRYLLG